MADEDFFFLRLQLLIIMAKGYLNGYPLGERRKAAVNENARLVFYQALDNSNRFDEAIHADKEGRSSDRFTHLFYQRIQLLAVMARSIATGHRLEGYRRQALEENIGHICGCLAEQLHLSDMPFLKVA
jgi:hypothetical protein